MNILVTGANGQLGNEMRIVSKNSADHYILRMSIRWKVRRPLTLISQIWKPSARW